MQAKIVPKDIQYDVDLEAGDISIVTPTPDAFGGGWTSWKNR